MNGRFVAFLLGPLCSCTEGGVRGWEPLGRRQETRLKGAGRAHERGEGWSWGGQGVGDNRHRTAVIGGPHGRATQLSPTAQRVWGAPLGPLGHAVQRTPSSSAHEHKSKSM